ncbi:S8 family serine peptidase [Luteipulveratus sp. YIM 133132]|uniref:S53 family peptidase n=1 Tax=Luteipulveratus flavus TaxID=3031728 RepID=UPI0023AE9789|nr:S8 family serine peptidase [Luteipulveratus sp. YIM 133132]MDE9366589.1 S8 family serine peptidase [Luteipulveratus sp. YIM 133132]
MSVAAVAGSTALTSVTPTAEAATCTGQWQRAESGLRSDFVPWEVKALGPTRALMAGTTYLPGTETGGLASWNGRSWSLRTVPGMLYAFSVEARDMNDAWVFGTDSHNADVIQHWDGKAWKKAPSLVPLVGEHGSVSRLLARGKNDLWAFGQVDNAVGTAVFVAHFDGTRWKLVANNLADATYAGAVDAKISPSGELWVLGAQYDPGADAISPWAGKLVNGAMRRVEVPSVPKYLDSHPASMTWTPSGSMVIAGTTGDELGGQVYPYTATGTPGGSWALKAQHAPVANNTTPAAVARIGSTTWSADSSGLVLDRQWTSLSTLGAKGWSAPQQLNQHRDERPMSMAGLDSGQGWLATWQDRSDSAAATPHLWRICGTPKAAAASSASALSAASAPSAIDDADSMTVATPAPHPSPAGIKPLTVSPAARRNARVAARKEGRLPDVRTGASARGAAELSGPRVSGPTVDRLRKAQHASASTSYVAKPVCTSTDPGRLTCLSSVLARESGGRAVAAVSELPAGYGPKELRSAYGLPASGGHGRTIAIIAAYGYPDLEKDLATYRKTAGLPSCTSTSGCLTVIGESGGKVPPPATEENTGWKLEQALDVQSASAACPDCKLLVVQATEALDENVARANHAAAARKPFVISASLGRQEQASDVQNGPAYVPAGIPYLAATGDAGHGTSWPATIPSVIGVGGTRLMLAPGSPLGWREDAWALGGSGCSAVQPKPVWERKDPLCLNGKASSVDISAVADPATGAGVFFRSGAKGDQGGWYVVGGTSLASPVVAGIFALRGAPVSSASLWNATTRTRDIVRGSDGWCAPARECTASKGYDGATGWGVPRP